MVFGTSLQGSANLVGSFILKSQPANAIAVTLANSQVVSNPQLLVGGNNVSLYGQSFSNVGASFTNANVATYLQTAGLGATGLSSLGALTTTGQTILANVQVNGTATFTSGITVSGGDASITAGNLIATSGGLFVNNSYSMSNISGGLGVGGIVRLYGPATAYGGITSNGNLSVSGITSLTGPVTATGGMTISTANLAVSGSSIVLSGNGTVTGIPAPVNSTDAVNLSYLQSYTQNVLATFEASSIVQSQTYQPSAIYTANGAVSLAYSYQRYAPTANATIFMTLGNPTGNACPQMIHGNQGAGNVQVYSSAGFLDATGTVYGNVFLTSGGSTNMLWNGTNWQGTTNGYYIMS